MTNGEGSSMPAAGQAATAAAARRAAAKQRRLELQQARKQQQRERQLLRQQQRQLRRQGALAAPTALDVPDLEFGEDGVGLRPGPSSAAPGSGLAAATADSAGAGTDSATAARALAGGSRRDCTARQGVAGVSQTWGALGRAAWWLAGGLIGRGPRLTQARELWAEPLADQDRAEGSASLDQGAAAASGSLAGAAEVGTSNSSSSSNACSRPFVPAAGAADTSAAGQGVGPQPGSSSSGLAATVPPPSVLPRGPSAADDDGAVCSIACRTDGDTVLTILPGETSASGISAAAPPPPAVPPTATGAIPCHHPSSSTSCSGSSSSSGSGCFVGHADPLEAAAAAKLHAVRAQAAKDRLALALPNPVYQVMGYLTGVMPAWPGLCGEGAEHQGQHGAAAAAPAAVTVGMGQQAHWQQLVQQQQQYQQRPQQDQQQLQDQQQVGVPVGSLLCLSSSANSSSSSSSGSSSGGSSGEESARFWDVQESGKFSCSSSGSMYFDAATVDDSSDIDQGLSVGTAGQQPVSTPGSAAAAAFTPFAAAATAAQGNRTELPAALLSSAAAVPPGTPSSSTTSISTTPPASPFAAAAVAVGPAQPTAFAGNEAAGNATPPFTALTAASLAHDAAAAAEAAPSTGRLATAASPGQQCTAELSSLLASSSTAAALDAIQGVDPVGSLGPGSATAMLLNPACTAPQALFNPAAALVGVRKAAEEDGEGTLSGLINRVIGSGGSSSSSGRSSPRAAGSASRHGTPAAKEQQGLSQGSTGDTVRGVLGTMGLQSGGHAAAGTVADTKGAGASSSSDGGSSHDSRAGDRIKALLPGHHRSSSSSGGSDSSSIGGGGSGSEDIAHRRYLFSLDVRRTSLASPLPGSEVAVLHTHLHLPVLPEGDEEDGA